MENAKQIKWGAVISYTAIIFNIIAGLLYTPWMIDSIGKDQYALYTLALSIINIFLMDFGIGSAVTRFLSKFYAQGKQQEANRFMGIVYKVYFAISVVIALGLFVFYFFVEGIYVKLTPSEMTVFKNLYIIVAAYSVLSFPCVTFQGVLMANEQFIAVKLCNLGQKVFNVLLIVVFLLLGKGIYAMVLVHAVTNVMFHAVRYLIIRFKTKQKAELKAWDKQQAKGLFDYSIWITVMSIAQRCIFNIMPSLIAALIGSTEVTLFGLAATLEGYVYTFADAINGMFMPRISRIIASNNCENELDSLMCKVGKFHVCTMGLLIVGFIGIGQQFVTLWLGPGNESVYICAVLLILPSLVEVPQQVARTSLLAMNVVKQQAIIYLIMASINISISILIIPAWGALGAAISICVAYMVRTFLFNLLYKKKLPVKLGRYFKVSYLKWSIPAIAALGTGFLCDYLFAETNILSFLLSGVATVLVYSVLLLVFDVDKDIKAKLAQKIFRK